MIASTPFPSPQRRVWPGRLARLGALLALCLVAAFGCDDDGGGGGGPTPIPCLDYARSATPSPGTVVADDGTGSTCNVAVVDLIVTDVNDVFGASFNVRFDPAVVAFTGASASGSVLGANVDVVQNVVASGEVSVGITRRQPDPGVDVVGGQRLIRLTFARVATGNASSSLSFVNASLLDSSAPPQPIPGITFSGGSMTVTTS